MRRSSTAEPGLSRRRCGRGFRLLDADGAPVPEETRRRVRRLAIPPAWRDVWICATDDGHLQAVGTDEAGRRQYLYHPDWRTVRDRAKFHRAEELGEVLGRARVQVRRHLQRPRLDETRVCAAAFRLLDLGGFRIGAESYTKENESFGLTTLRREHASVRGSRMAFRFPGKSGVDRLIRFSDDALAPTIRALGKRDDDDPHLLVFRVDDTWQGIRPGIVNDYIGSVTGRAVTAKDFRTWQATVIAAAVLAGHDPEDGAASAMRAAAEAAGDHLGNTPTVARNSYIDPRVLDRFENGTTVPGALAATTVGAEQVRDLERAVLRLLA